MGNLCKTGKSRQALYDAIKKSREDGEAWVTFGKRRLHLKSADELPDFSGYDCLVKYNGRILQTYVNDKGGLYIWAGTVCKRIQPKDILAVVVEDYDRNKATY